MASWMVHLRIADELLKAIDPMRKIKKKNYRLLIDAILDVETKTKIGKPVFFFCHKTGRGDPNGGKQNKGNYN